MKRWSGNNPHTCEYADVKFEKDRFMLGSSSTLKVYQFINFSLSNRARHGLGVDLYFFFRSKFSHFSNRDTLLSEVYL